MFFSFNMNFDCFTWTFKYIDLLLNPYLYCIDEPIEWDLQDWKMCGLKPDSVWSKYPKLKSLCFIVLDSTLTLEVWFKVNSSSIQYIFTPQDTHKLRAWAPTNNSCTSCSRGSKCGAAVVQHLLLGLSDQEMMGHIKKESKRGHQRQLSCEGNETDFDSDTPAGERPRSKDVFSLEEINQFLDKTFCHSSGSRLWQGWKTRKNVQPKTKKLWGEKKVCTRDLCAVMAIQQASACPYGAKKVRARPKEGKHSGLRCGSWSWWRSSRAWNKKKSVKVSDFCRHSLKDLCDCKTGWFWFIRWENVFCINKLDIFKEDWSFTAWCFLQPSSHSLPSLSLPRPDLLDTRRL